MPLICVLNTTEKHRCFPVEYKAKAVADFLQSDVSVTKDALKHGINTNLVHKWIRQAR